MESRGNRLKEFFKKTDLFGIFGVILFIILWYLIAILINEKQLVFPGPGETVKEFIKILGYKSTYLHILYTIVKTLIGFAISFILALILGSLAGVYEPMKKIFNPFIVFLKAVPTASLLFLFLTLSGVKYAPIYVVILITFPILYESVIGGISNIRNSLKDVRRIDGGSFFMNFRYVIFPLSLNYILVGVAASFGLSFKVEIMSEILSGDTNKGLGVAIKTAQISDVNMAPIFAYTLIAVIVLLIFQVIGKIIKKEIEKKVI